MLPLNRRRLAAAVGVCLGLAAAVTAAVALLGSRSPTPKAPAPVAAPSGPGDPGSSSCALGPAGLCDAVGVQQRLGQPSERRDGCWIYWFDKTTARLNVAPESDGAKYCFASNGALVEEYSHYRGHWMPQPLPPVPAPPPSPSQL